MKQRPNRFITETLIEIFEILLGEENRVAAKLRQRFGSDFVTNFIRDRASRPANPHQFGFAGQGTLRRGQQRSQSRGQASDAFIELNPLTVLHDRERQTIGNYYNSL